VLLNANQNSTTAGDELNENSISSRSLTLKRVSETIMRRSDVKVLAKITDQKLIMNFHLDEASVSSSHLFSNNKKYLVLLTIAQKHRLISCKFL